MSVVTWTVQSSKTFQAARLDAEDFWPGYARLEQAILDTGQGRRLGDIAQTVRRGLQPRYVEGGDVLVINSQHVGPHFINEEATERTDNQFFLDNERARAEKYDVLMNSTGVGTIGRVNCVLHASATVVDSHITVIRPDPAVCDPVYLAVFLNSALGRQQTNKWMSGSSGQLEVSADDIRKFWVLVPPAPVQLRVAENLKQAYRMRSESHRIVEGMSVEIKRMVNNEPDSAESFGVRCL